jgi:hypothetical protein
MWGRILCILSSAFLASCALIVSDRTDHENGVCEVHKLPMTIRELPCDSVYMGYTPEYDDAMRTQFPHYEGTRHGCLFSGRVRTHVCTGCSNRFHEWHDTHNLITGELK